MRILHVCLASFYIDNYGYQENILPKMHKMRGYDVKIVASTETYIDNQQIGYIEPKSYHTEESIPITRLPYKKYMPHSVMKKLRIYTGVSKVLNDFKPDIIFMHDVQFISVYEVAKYCKENPNTIVYADCHTDFVNSARGWVSKNILHGIIYKWCAKTIEPFVKMFYGVLPARVDFLREMYNIPEHKLDLLVMGADDSQYNYADRESIRKEFRAKHDIKDDDFVIVSGGKIERGKNTDLLLDAFSEIKGRNIKLVLFGSIHEEMKEEIKAHLTNEDIVYLGWMNTKDIYNVLLSSDLAVFPGTHSVLWEQSIGVGLPTIFKRWDGMEHVDIGGNCILLDNTDAETIKETILHLYENKEVYKAMKEVAVGKGIEKFSYSKIAKYALEQ